MQEMNTFLLLAILVVMLALFGMTYITIKDLKQTTHKN